MSPFDASVGVTKSCLLTDIASWYKILTAWPRGASLPSFVQKETWEPKLVFGSVNCVRNAMKEEFCVLHLLIEFSYLWAGMGFSGFWFLYHLLLHSVHSLSFSWQRMFSQSNNFIYQPFFPSLFLVMYSSPFLLSDISESLKLHPCRYLFHS